MAGRDRGRLVSAAAWPLTLVVVTMLTAAPRGEAAPTIESLPLAATYGDAVHSYFAGDYQRSYDDLSAVIEAGSTDPRAYYFRGLAALKLGRLDESEADFSTGATREAEATGTWPIARSLERIQGCDRLKLERHRVRARVALVQANRQRWTRRYEDAEQAAPEVLRTRRPTVDAEADAANPFEEVRPAEQPAEEPAEPMPEPEPAEEPVEPASEEPAVEEPVEELAPEREEAAEAVDEPMEEGAAAVEDTAEQVDERMEEGGAAAEDVPEQVEEQMEEEAAEGENAAEQQDQQAEAEPL